MKKYLAPLALVAGLLASPDPATARDFTPEELRAAAAKSRQINGPIEEAKAKEDIDNITKWVVGAALGIVTSLGAFTWGTLRKPDSSQPDDGSAPTEREAPAAQGPTPTDDEPTSPEAAESIVTGLDLVSSSLMPGHLLNSTQFTDQDGVEQDGISWDLSSSVGEFDTRAGKKAYRIDFRPSENEHFDQLVISISQLEKPGGNNSYFVKAAFQKTNSGGTISVPYLVSLKRLSPGDKLNRNKLCEMVKAAMGQIHNCSKVETPVASDLLKQVRDYVLRQNGVTTDSILKQFPDSILDQQIAGTVLALLRAEGMVGAVNDNGESEVIIPNSSTA